MQNVEVELKLRVKNKTKVRSWLKQHAKFLSSSRQIDYYFDPAHKTFLFTDSKGLQTADDYLRVRVNPKGGAVAIKRYHRELEAVGKAYIDEFETILGDPQKMLRILEILEFKLTATIDKKRESYSYRDFQFDCDEVKGLGFFVEVELKSHCKTPEAGYEKIRRLLAKIGISDWEEAKGGYVQMLWNQK
jgi:predicted adenylyl cyclase CyaB